MPQALLGRQGIHPRQRPQPEQILTREALLENHTTIVDQEDYQLQKLRRTFIELVHQDVKDVQQKYTSAG